MHFHTDVHLNTERGSHRRLSHRIQNETTICSEVRDERKEEGQKAKERKRRRKLKMKGT